MEYQQLQLIEKYGHQEIYSMSSSTGDIEMLDALVDQIPEVYLTQLASNPNLAETHIHKILSKAGEFAGSRSVYDNIMCNPNTDEKTLLKLIKQYPMLVLSIPYRDDFSAPFLHTVIGKLSSIQERPTRIYPTVRRVLYNSQVTEKTLRLVLKTWFTSEIMMMVAQHENVTPGMLLHMAKNTQQVSILILVAESSKATGEILDTIWRKKTSEKTYWTILGHPNVTTNIIGSLLSTPDAQPTFLSWLRLNPNYKNKLVELLQPHYEEATNTIPQDWLETLAGTVKLGKPNKELERFK